MHQPALGDVDLREGVQALLAGVAQRHADRPAVADHQRGQAPVLGDVDEPLDDALLLLGQRLATGVAPVLARVLPRLEELRIDLVVGHVGPVARVGLGEALVDDRLQADALAHDGRRLARALERAGVERGEVLLGGGLGELARLGDALLGQHRLRRPALKAALGVVGRLAVAGHEDHVAIVSERSPRRSVSSESTSSGAMLPRLTSGPKRSMNHTCWSLRGASKSSSDGSMAWAISSPSPWRTSPSWRKIPAVPDSRASAMTFHAPASSSASICSTQR